MNQMGSLESRNKVGIASHEPHSPCGCLQVKSPPHAGTTGDGLLHWLGTGITPTCLPWAPEDNSDDYSK
jgi:hypothetical protein